MAQPQNEENRSPSLLGKLSPQEQVELTEILDRYLMQLEEHEHPCRSELLQRHPQLAEVLELYLDKLDELYRVTEAVPRSGTNLDGKMLGDFRLESEIGRGGMGIVFSARNERLNRRVAVKLLPMAALLDDKFVERFKNEARAAANLEHPNIVPVYSIGEEGGIHFFAMRLIEGASLDRRVARHQADGTKPPTIAALRQFSAIADALHNAHEYGIVHRDIKPSNLLLDEGGKLWVADFGLARCQADSALTRTGEMIGTMRYMSPEQATGRSELVDHTTDIYSLGATLYELLTLKPAIDGEEGPSLLTKIASQPPLRLRKIRLDVPVDVQTVVEKAMARNKSDRYSTAKEFADDLRNLVDGNPINARPVSFTVRATRLTVKHGLASAVVASLLLLAAIGLVTSNHLIQHERDEAREAAVHAEKAVGELMHIFDGLAAVPGAEQVRRSAIQRILSYYDSSAQQSDGNPSARAKTAAAYTQAGALFEELGQLAEAVARYQAAEAIYQRLVQSEPNVLQHAAQRNKNLNFLGLALASIGQTTDAVQTLEGAVAVQRDGVQLQTEKTDLALSLNNYGLALKKANRKVAARLAFEESIQLLEKARAKDLADHEVARGLGAAYQNYGSLLSRDHPAKAMTVLGDALAIQLKLSDSTDNRLRASRDLISTYLSLGNVQLEQRKLKPAITSFRHAVSIGEKLVYISPEIDGYKRDLAISLSNLGMAEYQNGNADSSLESLVASEKQYRVLIAAHPDNAGLTGSLGIALNNQAIVLQHMGKNNDADRVYSEAATVLEAAQLDEPSSTQWGALNKVYVNHARMLHDAGKDTEAAEIIERKLALTASQQPES